MLDKANYQPTPDGSSNVVRKTSDRAAVILEFSKAYFGDLLSKKTMLDIGCNTGYFVDFFASEVASIEGFDISSDNIKKAKSFYPEIAENVKTGDIFIDLYMRDQYDIVLFLNLLHTMVSTKPEEEVKNILKEIDKKTNDMLFLEMREDQELYWIPQELDDVVSRPIIPDYTYSWGKEKIKNFIFDNTSFNTCQEIMVSADTFHSPKRIALPTIHINRTMFAFYRVNG